MIRRDQSEDYSRPQDVIVFRDTPNGIIGSPMIAEPVVCMAKPTTAQLIDAAEALLLQSRERVVYLTTEDLREQLSLDRGVRFDEGVIAAAAFALFDATTDDPARFAITDRWLRQFRTFLDTRPSTIS